ncbi:TetR/AcrR family transcriptional regulator [Scytonema sp. NUACC21]
MPTVKVSSETRDAILQAASQIVLTSGTDKLTLEAVAREAGVSKGGLLYHFPNKEALIAGMISQIINDLNAKLSLEFNQDRDSDTSKRLLRAYIRANFPCDRQLVKIGAGLLAAIAVNPNLLQPVRADFDQIQQKIEESGADPVVATIIRLAVDGLWMADMFGLAAPDESSRQKVMEALLALT